MSEVMAAIVEALNARLGSGFDGVARFVIRDAGVIVVDAGGARADDAGTEADVTLTADMATFRGIFEGEVSPTAAFMSGRLRIEGSMGMAMKLAGRLA